MTESPAPLKKQYALLLTLVAICLTGLQAAEQGISEVPKLLATDMELEGIVFEIMTWGDDSWLWAAPMLSAATQKLRKKYPDLEIVLISHGNELFDLTLKNNRPPKPEIQILKRLSDANVSFHVAGDFAKFKRLGSKDFLPFVDVSPSGVAQLEDYIKLGFEHIVLVQPNATD